MGGWRKKWGEGRREKEKPTWIQVPSYRWCETQAALPKVSITGQFFPRFCGFHTNFNLLKLTTTMEGGVINNSVAIKELPVTSTLQEAAQFMERGFSRQSWSKYCCRSVDERRHRRASLPCQASRVLTFERQCCANSISVASIRELLLDDYSIGTKYKSSRPWHLPYLSKPVPHPIILSFRAFKMTVYCVTL